MFLRPFCSPSLACAKFPGARLRRLPDERRRPGYRSSLITRSGRAQEGHSPPRLGRVAKKRFVWRKILYSNNNNNINNDESIQLFFILLYFLFFFLFKAATAIAAFTKSAAMYHHT